jgi:hypothetical protein
MKSHQNMWLQPLIRVRKMTTVGLPAEETGGILRRKINRWTMRKLTWKGRTGGMINGKAARMPKTSDLNLKPGANLMKNQKQLHLTPQETALVKYHLPWS